MTASIRTNIYRNPYNGSQYTSARYPSSGYSVYNGWRNGAKYMPNAPVVATDVAATVGTVAADNSTLLMKTPDGQSIPFEFVRAGSTPTAGFITIAVPAGGGTVTQQKQAIVDAFNAGSGVPVGGTRRYYYPFFATALSAGAFTIVYTLSGTVAAPAGTQTGTTFVFSQGVTFAPVSPAGCGPLRGSMPGSLAA